MGKSTSIANSLLKLLYNAVGIANLADNTATSPNTSIWIALHTADPGVGGSQTTNEVSYTGYARVAVARTSAGFSVTAAVVALAAQISFAQNTGNAAGQALFFSTGTAATGAGVVLHSGPLGSTLGDFTMTTAGVVTSPAHGLAVNNTVCFEPPIGGGALPTGITAGTLYYVLTTPSVDTFTVGTTQGGSAITPTASGDGVAFKVIPIVLSANAIPQLGTGTTVTEG